MRIIYLIDFNCPYSYIGLERIKKAAERLNLDIEWEMRSFELEPSAGKRQTITIHLDESCMSANAINIIRNRAVCFLGKTISEHSSIIIEEVISGGKSSIIYI